MSNQKMESMYGKIRVRIKGISPLLMNRLTVEKLKGVEQTPVKIYDEADATREVAYITVVDGEEQLYIPAYAVYACILHTARGYNTRRRKLSESLSGCIRIEPDKILLGHCNYEVFVSIGTIIRRGRFKRARAKVLEWEAEFFIIYIREVLTKFLDTLQEVVEVSGRRAGLLDWRPQKKGKFGKFIVEEYSILS